MASIRPIAGSLANPKTQAVVANQISDVYNYSRLIEFRLSEANNILKLTAHLVVWKNKNVTITFDTNFDNKYDNEQTYIIADSSNLRLTNCDTGILIKLALIDSPYTQTITNLKWLPFNCLGLKINDNDTIFTKYGGAVYCNELLYGYSSIIEDSLCIIVQNKFFDIAFEHWLNPQFAIIAKDHFHKKESKRLNYENIGETIIVNNSLISVSKYNGKTKEIHLSKSEIDQPIGFNPGFYIDTSQTYPTINNTRTSFKPRHNRYTLLEFWGTWCTPCIQLYPTLDSLLSNLSEQINYVGVAFNKDELEVKQYVKKKPRIQNQIFVAISKQKSNGENLVDKFKITNYPTFLLIDQTGKIISREIGLDGFKRIKEFILTETHLKN